MTLGPFGEVLGTTQTFDFIPEARNYQSNVVAPRNPKLVINKSVDNNKLTSSQYIFSMSMTMKQKYDSIKEITAPNKIALLDMADYTYQKNTNINIDQPLFQPFPSELVFINYRPSETYILPLILRNQDKAPRLVKIQQPDSLYFKVVSPTNISHKLAGGLAHTFMIHFTPDDTRDYKEQLLVITEREKFYVPIKCIGSRALLDFPDEIVFPPTTVKYKSEKILLVRNIGNRNALVQLKCSGPFTIYPVELELPINESAQIRLDFCPQAINQFSNELVIFYDTGEHIYVRLLGEAFESNIRLEKSSLHIDSTYVGMLGTRTVTLHNYSEIPVNFKWTRYASQLEESQVKQLKIQSAFEKESSPEEYDSKQTFSGSNCNELSNSDFADQMALSTQQFENEKWRIASDRMLFEDDIVSITPLEGSIWSKSSAEITIRFVPNEAREFIRVAYCDVTGRENRLPLKITGQGIGPKIKFSYKKLSMGKIFIGSRHSYDLVVGNRGDIDALFCISAEDSIKTPFTECFKFVPDDGIICPDAYQSIKITFCSPNNLGNFEETFLFKFDGCPDPEKVIFTGTVVGPTFDLNCSMIDFGIVAYGFLLNKELIIRNTSLIAMTVNLRISANSDPILDHDSQFEIEPNLNSLTIDPVSEMRIKIKYLPEKLGALNAEFIVDVEKVGQRILTIPLLANCVVPEIKLKESIIEMNRCFLDFDNASNIELVNESNLFAHYELLPSPKVELCGYNYSTEHGIIAPKSIFQVPLKINIFQSGALEIPVQFKIAGSNHELITARIRCFGEGPVVNVEPRKIDWGIIEVLKPDLRKMTLTNESPIKANFRFEMYRKDSIFITEPSTGVIEPYKKLQISLFACADDTLLFKDRLLIFIEHLIRPITVELLTTGQGTTIIMNPEIPVKFSLGPHFSTQPLTQNIEITNKGRRPQQMIWSVEGFSSTKAARKRISNVSNAEETEQYQHFIISPHRSEISPGESIKVSITAQTTKPGLVKGTIFCHTIVGRRGTKELIKRCEVSVNFISPMINYSSQSLSFYIEKCLHKDLKEIFRNFTMRNDSGIILECNLEVSKPFSLLVPLTDDQLIEEPRFSQNLVLVMDIDAITEISVKFDPLFKSDRTSWKLSDRIKISYKDHFHQDQIHLSAQVHFPNIKFNFPFVDFGFILNYTEKTRIISLENTSPLPVHYSWSYLIGDKPNIVFKREAKLHNSIDNGNKIRAALPKLHLDDADIGEIELNPVVNEVLQSLLDEDREVTALGIEEVFNISPLSGVLKPFETVNITINLYGHPDIEASVTALCTVQDGPHYTLPIEGGSSKVDYELNREFVNFGWVNYNQKSKEFLLLKNTSKVPFDYRIYECSSGVNSDDLFEVTPSQGYLKQHEEVLLEFSVQTVKPGPFFKHFFVQIAHFPTQSLTCFGMATFPCLRFDLPRYEKSLESILVGMHLDRCDCGMTNSSFGTANVLPRVFEKLDALQAEILEMTLDHGFIHLAPVNSNEIVTLPDYICDFGHVVLGEVVSKTIHARNISPFPVSISIDKVFAQDAYQLGFSTNLTKVKALPSTVNDEHSPRPKVNGDNGFIFEIVFDPRGANAKQGPINTGLIFKGPLLHIRIKSNVCIPSLTCSAEHVDFGKVKVGEAKIITVQIHNPCPVMTTWEYLKPNARSSHAQNKQPKFGRKPVIVKVQEPPTFEILTSKGCLIPGQRINVQVKFAPLSNKHYEERIVFRIHFSSSRLHFVCTGDGQEPILHFEVENNENFSFHHKLVFNPILPSGSDEKVVTVTNPCDFPVEIYSLEFDKEFRKEDEVLAKLEDYDENGTLLLPVRVPGDVLPNILYDHHNEVYSQEKIVRIITEDLYNSEQHLPGIPSRSATGLSGGILEKNALNQADELRSSCATKLSYQSKQILVHHSHSPSLQIEPNQTDVNVNFKEASPVTKLLADYLKVDLSESSLLARSRKGLAAIVHKPPVCPDVENDFESDFLKITEKLTDRYQASLMKIDDIVVNALKYSQSDSAKKAHHMCLEVGKNLVEVNGLLQKLMGYLQEEKTSKTITIKELLQLFPDSADFLVEENYLNLPQIATRGRKASNQPMPSKTHDKNAPVPQETNLQQLSKLTCRLPVTSFIKIEASQSSNNLIFCPVDDQVEDAQGILYHFIEIPLFSIPLSEDILLDLMMERFACDDCQQGIVFNGLESLFIPSYNSALEIVLKALNNRRFIYGIVMNSDYKNYQDMLNTRKVRILEEEKCREDEYLKFVLELDEVDYAGLSELERQKIDEIRLQKRREKRRIEIEKCRELEEERARLESEQRKSEDKTIKKVGKNKGETTARSVVQADAPSALSTRPSKQPTKEGSGANLDGIDSRSTDRTVDAIHKDEDRGKKGSRKGSQLVGGKETFSGSNLSEMNEDEHIHQLRYAIFESEMKNMIDLLSKWDRTSLRDRSSVTPMEKSDGLDFSGLQGVSVPSSKKTKSSSAKKSAQALKDTTSSISPISQSIAQLAQPFESLILGPYNISEGLEILPDFYSLPAIGIPNIILELRKNQQLNTVVTETPQETLEESLLKVDDVLNVIDQIFPTLESFLNACGIGPKGPPIPEPAIFNVVRFSQLDRIGTAARLNRHPTNFIFVSSGPDDPNVPCDSTTIDQTIPETVTKTTSHQGPGSTTSQSTSALGRTMSTAKKSTSKNLSSDLNAESSQGTITSTSEQIITRRSNMNLMTGSSNSVLGKSRRESKITIEEAQDDTLLREHSGSGNSEPLNKFRWIIPANSCIQLRIKFTAAELGIYTTELNFEVMGSRNHFSLSCEGLCMFPSIETSPSFVFESCIVPSVKPTAITFKKYIMDKNVYEFGPLLIEKTKERVCQSHYQENQTVLNIKNNSPVEAEITAAFLNDPGEENFSLSTKQMALMPEEVHQVTLYAHPKITGRIDDSVVFCVKDNPEPIQFKISSEGVLPEIEMDKKYIHFDRVLLYRKELKSIKFYNPTKLPIAWRITGFDCLGEDFTVNQDCGIIGPRKSFEFNLLFRAMKPYKTSQKKSLRLEVYDSENLAGVIQVENITVIAEAYDVALDLIYPKGCDGFVDFGTVKVGDESKQSLTLKNKGQYDIQFSLEFEPIEGSKTQETWEKFFSLQPMKGTLHPGEKAVSIIVTYRAICEELIVKNTPIFKCQVVEPNPKGTDQLIACIPVKVGIRSLFSKFTISPSKDIDFGAILVQNRKTRQFVIENQGEFEFKFSISKFERLKEISYAREQSQFKMKQLSNNDQNLTNRDQGISQPAVPGTSRPQVSFAAHNIISLTQGKLQVGLYTISPASGSISPGNAQLINVEFVADIVGECHETLGIEITDRDIRKYKLAVPYKLTVESCIPSIEIDNFSSIFEEHRILPSIISRPISILSNSLEEFITCTYFKQENCFQFDGVLVGNTVKARIRINNPTRVPTDISCSIRAQGATNPSGPSYQSGRVSSRSTAAHAAQIAMMAGALIDSFEVSPSRLQIKPLSYANFVISFAPQALQTYEASFDVTLENIPTGYFTSNPTAPSGMFSVQTAAQSEGKSRIGSPLHATSATFESVGATNFIEKEIQHGMKMNFKITGQGQLPHFSLVKPSLRKPSGQPVCIFKRLKNGLKAREPLIISNNGHLPATIRIDLNDPDDVFKILIEEEQDCIEYLNGRYTNNNSLDERTVKCPHTASIQLSSNEKCTLFIEYSPRESNAHNLGQILISVLHNSYEDLAIEVLAETLDETEPVYLEGIPHCLDASILTILRNNVRNFVGGLKSEYYRPKPDLSSTGQQVVASGGTNSNSGSGNRPQKGSQPPDVKSTAQVSIDMGPDDPIKIEKERESSFDDWEGHEVICHNHLDFGDCPVNEPMSQIIHLTYSKPLENQEAPIIRFQWLVGVPGTDEIVSFQPTVGHLRPGSSKPIRVVLKANTGPILMCRRSITCRLTKIRLLDSRKEHQLWDDSKYSIRWVDYFESFPEAKLQPNTRSSTPATENSKTGIVTNQSSLEGENLVILPGTGIFRKKRVTEQESEPEFEIYSSSDSMEQTQLKSLQLQVSAIIDYSRVQCESRWINFKDTHILELRKQNILITNKGIVSCSFKLNLKMDQVVTSNSRKDVKMSVIQESESLEGSIVRSESRTSLNSRPLTARSSMNPSPMNIERPKTGKGRWDVVSVSQTSPQIDFGSLMPFSINPNSGTILPGQSIEIEIEFAPLTAGIFNCKLVCELDNAAKNLSMDICPNGINSTPASSNLSIASKPSAISKIGSTEDQCTAASLKSLESVSMFQVRLTGCSKPSFVYINELPFSDYLTTGRRNTELPGPLGASPGLPLDSATRVIEMKTTDYEFEWISKDGTDETKKRSRKKFLQISPQKGVIVSGKRFMIKVNHLSDQIGIVESFWELHIPRFNFHLPFLLVADCLEPLVSFDKCHISFPLMLVGHRLTREVNLINSDLDRSYMFRIDEQSLFGPSAVDQVHITPMSGVLHPTQQLPLQVTFKASGERQVNINVLCYIEGKTAPLNVNIKANCYTMSLSVWLDSTLSNNGQNPCEVNKILPYCEGICVMDAIIKNSKKIVGSKDLNSLCKLIDFGIVQHGEQSLNTISVINHGQLNLEYAWHLGPSRLTRIETGPGEPYALSKPEMDLIDRYINVTDSVISVYPKSGVVEPGKKTICTIRFSPGALKGTRSLIATKNSKQICLDNLVSAFLGIRDGPVYAFSLFGKTAKPSIDFSAEQLNFGRVFIYQPGLNQACLILTISNCDLKNSITVEMISSLETSPFSHDFSAKILKPSEKVEILIKFAPSSVRTYREILEFEVNGLTRYGVVLEGVGISLGLDIEKSNPEIIPNQSIRASKRPSDPKFRAVGRFINFGILKINERSRLMLRIKNPTNLDVFLHSINLTPINKSLQSDPSIISWRIMYKSLSNPEEGILIPSNGGHIDVEVIFHPKTRLAAFTEQLVGQFSAIYNPEIMKNCPIDQFDSTSGTIVPLCLFKGLCQGSEFRFDTQQVSFGAIVLGSELNKRLLLLNTGDIGSKFEWLAHTLPKELRISPMKGYSTPGTQTVFDVFMKPSELVPDIRIENITCKVEEFGELKFIASGLCVPPQIIKEVQNFQCSVRGQDQRMINLINRTNVPWLLKPVIETLSLGGNTGSLEEYWTGPEIFEVPQQQQRAYTLTYNPLTMTLDGKKHQGSIMFPLPDGTGLYYQLIGSSEIPKPMDKISREIQSKTQHVELISVTNWLKNSAQRFKVSKDIVKPDKPDPSLKITGLDFLEIPPGGKKQYKLTIHAYKEGLILIKINFTNEATGEYIHGDLQYKVVRGGPQESLSLVTAVRQSKLHQIRLENPLTSQILFQVSSNLADLRYPSQVQIPGKSEGCLALEYFPLKVGRQIGKLEVGSSELGIFEYDISLHASEPLIEPVKSFNTYLGQSQTQLIKFTNFAKVKSDFSCKIDCSEFICDKSISLPHGSESTLEVTYEPTQLGSCKATLVVSSSVAGDYYFPLIGQCQPSVPIGPIGIRPGDSVFVPFKNVFNSNLQFTFSVDNPVFHLAKTSETIRAKKEYRISISLEAPSKNSLDQNVGAPIGKLIVNCAKYVGNSLKSDISVPTATSANVQWVYYLKGLVNPSQPGHLSTSNTQPSFGGNSSSLGN